MQVTTAGSIIPFRVWRPMVPNSIDGAPLATEVSDLLTTFPRDRLPIDAALVAALMRPSAPIALALLYVGSVPALRWVRNFVGLTGKSSAFRYVVAVHNLAMAAFSAVVFVNSWPAVLLHVVENGWEETYCDRDSSLWTTSGLGGWATIFYISKFYEFLDTYILVMKGKSPSFLQLYHHAGIVITMWGGIVSQSTWIMIVVLLNSGIHTVMYTYFFIKTLDPGRKIAAAKYLTSAQILQFVTGIGFVQIFGKRECDSPASRYALVSIQLYALGLIHMFLGFASKKYGKRTK